MTDYIDREAAKKEIVEFWEVMPELRHCKENQLKRIDSVPAADVRPVVRGKWVINNGRWCCDKCTCQAIVLRSPYCPNCGAKMEGVK